MPPKKKQKKDKTTKKDQTLFDLAASNPHITITSVQEQYLQTEILLDDLIYGSRVPETAKGKLFLYTVHEYNKEDETFTVKYKMQAIDPEGSTFYAFAEGEGGSVIPGFSLKSIKEGRSLYLQMANKTKAAENDKRDKMRKELEEARKDPTKVDYADIESIIENDPDGGKSFDIVKLEFCEIDHDDNDNNKKKDGSTSLQVDNFGSIAQQMANLGIRACGTSN